MLISALRKLDWGRVKRNFKDGHEATLNIVFIEELCCEDSAVWVEHLSNVRENYGEHCRKSLQNR